jgi:hypothetical protein
MSRRAELGTALIWFGLGAAIAVASWRMDRLGHLGINPWSVPGLTPGAIGVLIMLFALALGWQALGAAEEPPKRAQGERADADADTGAGAAPAEGSARRTVVAGLLCVLFAGVTLGRGVPFVVEGSVFVFVFTVLFSWSSWRAEGRIGRGLAQTLVIAVVACVLISGLFERVFLVRLP